MYVTVAMFFTFTNWLLKLLIFIEICSQNNCCPAYTKPIFDWNPGVGLELIIYYFKTVLCIVTFFLFVSMFVSYILFVCVFFCVCATMCFCIFYIFFFFIFLSLFSFVNSVYSLVLQTQSIYQFPKIKKN